MVYNGLMLLFCDRIETPVGDMHLVCDTRAVRFLNFTDHPSADRAQLGRYFAGDTLIDMSNPKGFSDRVRDYFGGNLHAIDAIPVDPAGRPFQKQVWLALRNIPAGETISYGQQAASIGRPTASRAVGMANGQNPVSIILPCHRVIGANGRLTGYGGGLLRKQWLLDFERRHADIEPAPLLAIAGL